MRKCRWLIWLTILIFALPAHATPEKEWTYLFFMNGNNNLDWDTEMTIRDMERVGSNDHVNIVMQWASLSTRKTVRMLITKSTQHDRVTSPIVEDLGRVDMGDKNNLAAFIKWGVEHYPAKHYFINISDHGFGWHDSSRSANTIFSDISRDDMTGNTIKTEELGEVMANAAQVMGHKVDLLATDACVMAMVEVANELTESVNIYAGSQDYEPGSGWPYAKLLTQWQATPNISAEAMAKILAKTYVKSYGTRDVVTYSAFRLEKLAKFDEAVAQLTADIQALSPKSRALIRKAAQKTFQFSEDYRDFRSFIKQVASARTGIENEDLQTVLKAFDEMLVVNAVSMPYAGKVFGMSVWLPTSKRMYRQYASRYKNMKFDQATYWGDMLDLLMQG